MRIVDALLQLVEQDSDAVQSPLAELQSDLLATSYVFRSGHRRKMSLAMTDIDQFPSAHTTPRDLPLGN